MIDNIQFEEEQTQLKPRPVFVQKQATGITAWLIRKGIIKDESSARSILSGIVIFNFVLTALVIYFFIL